MTFYMGLAIYWVQQESNGVRAGGMEEQMRRVAYLSVLLPLLTMSLWAEEENQEPVVTNARAKRLDYEDVLIRYDVEDGDGDLMSVSVKVSDEGGKTFGLTVLWSNCREM